MLKGAGGVELDTDALYDEVCAALREGKDSLSFDKLKQEPSMPDFEKLYGAKADKVRRLYNGMIPCNLYQYFKPKG